MVPSTSRFTLIDLMSGMLAGPLGGFWYDVGDEFLN
jgi:hypothetical protein